MFRILAFVCVLIASTTMSWAQSGTTTPTTLAGKHIAQIINRLPVGSSSSFYAEPPRSSTAITVVKGCLVRKAAARCPFLQPLAVRRGYLMRADRDYG
jgi:hypothetical protein